MQKHIQRIVYGAFILLALSKHLCGQSALFNHLTTEQGLSNNSISCIIQDKKGFIWIGTYMGLNKYDGYKVTQYLPDEKDSSKLLSASIRCLFADDDHNLWIGTNEGGLSKLDLQTNKFTNYYFDSLSKNCISSNIINDINEFEPGKLYIATNNGLNILDKKTNKFTYLNHKDSDPNSLLADPIKTISKDKNGNIWFGHSGYGITQFSPKNNKFKRYTASTESSPLKVNKIRCIFTDSKGMVWISMWHGGITFYDPKTAKFWNEKDSSSIFKNISKLGLVSQIIEDKNSDIWMCTAEKGIAKFVRQTGELLFFENNPDDPGSISDNTNLCIMQDHMGLIWSGTWKGGLNYFDPQSLKFGHLKHESNKVNTLNDNTVYSFFENKPNEIIIGTAQNLCVFNPTSRSFSTPIVNEKDPNSLRQNSQVTCILKDLDDTYWYTTNGGGLYHYFPSTKKFKQYRPTNEPNSLSHEIPNSLILDDLGQLWIGTYGGGLNLYDRKNDSFTTYLVNEKDESLIAKIITCIVKDSKGLIWIASEKGGLIKLDPKTKTFERQFKNTPKALVYQGTYLYLFLDGENKIWASCATHLIEINTANQTYIDHSENNKTFQSDFLGIAKDLNNDLWITSSTGLYRYDVKTKNVKVYLPSDGIQSKEFNFKCIQTLSNGYLIAGGINGFNYFDPKDITENTIPPLVAFTDLLVLNKAFSLEKDISHTEELILSYRDYFFSLQFSAFDFSNSQSNKYKYKLDGFNEDWIEIGEQHLITFTNLDPGTYLLNIKASNSKGIWSEKPLTLKITITPPFWRTTWFYLLCIIISISGIYFYIKYRERKLQAEKALLEQKVDERTTELHEEKLKVEEAHKDIKDSIQYAQKIQSAILPHEDDLKRIIPDSFILFKPKDIVSGDFYWVIEKNNYVFCAVADCTGHGVPGGFMTMLGNGLLNEIVNEQHLLEPSDILNKLREKIITSLKQTGRSGENKDGMDIVLFRFNKTDRTLTYATANNGFIVVQNNSFEEHYGDKQPVGIYGHDIKPFSSHSLILPQNAVIYSYTDGFPDQFGGPKGKKFKYKALNELLVSVSNNPMEEQRKILLNMFESWKGELEQTDDVCLLGVRF